MKIIKKNKLFVILAFILAGALNTAFLANHVHAAESAEKITDAKVTQKQSFWYGNVTVGVAHDYTLYAITGNAYLYEPMYNKFKITDITSI